MHPSAPPRPRRAARLAAGGVALAVALAAPRADAVTLQTTEINRTGTLRDTGHGPYDISYADCTGNNDFTFGLASLTIGDAVSVWATGSGSDCLSLQQRQQGNCKEVVAETQVTATSYTVTVGAAAVANAMPSVASCVDSGSTTAPRTVKLYFLVDASSTDPVADYATYDTNVDLLGPAQLSMKSAETAGDASVVVSWSVPTTLTDIQGYQVFCEVASSGSGGSGGASGSCAAPSLVPGEVPSSALACGGTIASNTGSSTVDGLTTGVIYAFGVNGHDVVGNEGVLSDIVCGTPQPVDEFFSVYRAAGGKGGGGCAIAGPGRVERFGGTAAVLAAVGLAAAARRARRRA